MNIRRIIVLGLLLGLLLNMFGILINGVILRDVWSGAFPVRPEGSIGGLFGLFLSLLSDFVFGPAIVWLYAAMQPRFGATISTALRACFIIWILGVAIPYIGIVRIGWLPIGLVAATSFLALLSFLPAAWLTVRFYRA